ncbi:MAG: hypothetical protein J7598_19180 [Mitsuaria chitosanitabida]|uniref:hypothetical protein n=1 Tax=Roseateles chitosanitabidus TaxID=65048 RepID=UPI001B1FFEF2|nr:hypothetical protein [Roseateles chitosanitabidus]MBO9688731.1 hypothetical protein [Roseateles chitosanitabidus]
MKLRHLSLPFALLASVSCWAQSQGQGESSNPWYLGASLGHYYTSNVFRTNEASNSDQLTSISLLAGLDTRLGRQHLRGSARLNDTRYNSNSRLNNNGYDLAAGVDWETVGNLSGTVDYTRSRQLADFNSNTGIAPTTDRNLQTDQSLGGSVRLGLPNLSPFIVEGTFQRRERDYSLALWDTQEYRQNTSSLGLLYNASSAWRFGVAGRYTKGSVPVNGFAWSRKDIDLTALWRATGSSSLNARISRSTSDSFTGVTGSLTWNWAPGGRWSFNTKLSRDTGIETYYLGINNGLSDFNRVQTALQTQFNYRLTGKLTAQAGVGVTRLSRNGDIAVIGDRAKDNSTQYSLGLAWEALRNVTVGCQYTRLNRDTSNVVYTYNAYTAGCYVQGTLR